MDDGLTDLLQDDEPVPVTVPPPLLNVKVQLPVAVTVPVIFVLETLQIVTLELVIFAVGRVLTVIVAEPVKSIAKELHCASVNAVIV